MVTFYLIDQLQNGFEFFQALSESKKVALVEFGKYWQSTKTSFKLNLARTGFESETDKVHHY